MRTQTLAVTVWAAVVSCRGRAPALAALFAAVMLFCWPAGGAYAAIFTVTTNDGGPPAADGLCSLREAIENARNNALINADCLVAGEAAPALDEIRFNIGGGGIQTIALTSGFPVLTGGPLTIDATTQPGAAALPRITLDGVGAGATTGFVIAGADVTVRGFAIVRFQLAGVRVTAGAQRASIQGNHIGVDRTGVIAQGNGGGGIEVNTAFTLQIGGTGASERNVISGNGGGSGISILNVTGATIQGNRIGTDVNGAVAIPNGTDGIQVAGVVSSLVIGGTAAGAGNLISGNVDDGIDLTGDTVVGTVIEGNQVGTNLAGGAALPNGNHGIEIVGARNTRVGGTTLGARNLISGNAQHGIFLDNNASGTQIYGNWIGLNAAGTGAIPNIGDGIRFEDAIGSVGDGTAASRNVISGNGLAGIHLGSASSNVGIRSNYIGTNFDGTAAVPNTAGIRLSGTNHAIGGNSPTAGNLISGNTEPGIAFNSAQLVDVRNNLIGTDVTGAQPLGNGTVGIGAFNNSNRISIGHLTQAGLGNTVAFNGSRGISIADSDRIGIVDNRIFSNGQLGIELVPAGVTPNDQGDGDAGANTLQNFPVIQTADSNGTTTVTGTLNTTPNTNGIRIQVFSNTACDPSGHGEGQRFLGEVTVNTDGNGNANWQIANLPAVGVGAIITATASSPSGFSFNTSEFSACFTATAIPPTPTPTPSPGPSPSPTPTATPGPVDPTDPADNNNGNGVGQPKNEKADDSKETEEQQRQRERTNRGNRDDDHTEGNVVAVDLASGPPTATIATRDGLQVIVLLCRDSCDDPEVGDYLEADGVKEHEGLFYADSVTSRPPGRR